MDIHQLRTREDMALEEKEPCIIWLAKNIQNKDTEKKNNSPRYKIQTKTDINQCNLRFAVFYNIKI